MSENYHNPVDHGPIGSAAITTRETVKGGFGGVFSGAVRGGLWGALITGGTTALGIAAVGAAIAGGWGLLVPGITALGAVAAASSVFGPAALIGGLLTSTVGLIVGTAVGTPVGAVAGSVVGFSNGRDVVNHERGAARVMETVRQQNDAMTQTAMAQMATANALRAEVIRQASASPAPYIHMAQHQGVGMRQAASVETGPKTHVQRAAKTAAAQATNAQQIH